MHLPATLRVKVEAKKWSQYFKIRKDIPHKKVTSQTKSVYIDHGSGDHHRHCRNTFGIYGLPLASSYANVLRVKY